MKHERGNILFLILLAIVLFVALSYAVMSSREQVSDGVPKEKANAYAAQLLQHANLIENTMMRAMTVEGVPEWGFDVSSAIGSNMTANATCTASNCKIYSDNGGPIPPLTTPDFAFASSLSSDRKVNYRVHRAMNVGTDLGDLVLVYYGLKKEICEALNNATSVSNSQLGVSWGWGATTLYSGTQTSMPVANPSYTIANTAITANTKRDYCFLGGAGGGYTYIHVLMAR